MSGGGGLRVVTWWWLGGDLVVTWWWLGADLVGRLRPSPSAPKTIIMKRRCAVGIVDERRRVTLLIGPIGPRPANLCCCVTFRHRQSRRRLKFELDFFANNDGWSLLNSFRWMMASLSFFWSERFHRINFNILINPPWSVTQLACTHWLKIKPFS